MKPKTKSTEKEKSRKTGPSSTKGKQRVEDRGLNEDDQNRITNAPEDKLADASPDVEQEEDREKKRRVEDARGED